MNRRTTTTTMAVMASRSKPRRKVVSLYNLDPSFYNKIISRKSSVGNSDSLSGHPCPPVAAVPFVWELHPGTPKLLMGSNSKSKFSPPTPPASGRRSPPPASSSSSSSFSRSLHSLTNLTAGVAKVRKTTTKKKRQILPEKRVIRRLGSRISGKVREVFWKSVDGAHKRVKDAGGFAGGKKMMRRLKARVTPVDRRDGSPRAAARIREYFSSSSRDVKCRFSSSSRDVKCRSDGCGSSEVAVSPAAAWRSVLGKKLLAKWNFVKTGVVRVRRSN